MRSCVDLKSLILALYPCMQLSTWVANVFLGIDFVGRRACGECQGAGKDAGGDHHGNKASPCSGRHCAAGCQRRQPISIPGAAAGMQDA